MTAPAGRRRATLPRRQCFSLAFAPPRFMNGGLMKRERAATNCPLALVVAVALAVVVAGPVGLAVRPARADTTAMAAGVLLAAEREHPGAATAHGEPQHPVTASHQDLAGAGAEERHAAAASSGAEHEGAGAPEGTPSIDLKTLGLQLLNFAVLLFILVKFGGGAMNKALAARHHQLKADLASAADLRALAEAKLSKQEARLASLESEIDEMRQSVKAEAAMEKTRLIAAAEERAERIKAETSFLVEQQVRQAEVRLRRDSAEAALKLAEEILRRAIGAADQQRLLETFVGDVEQPAVSPGGTGRAA